MLTSNFGQHVPHLLGATIKYKVLQNEKAISENPPLSHSNSEY